MCFASSLVESHKKLFLEPLEGASSSSLTSGTTSSINAKKLLLFDTDKRRSKMSRSKSRIQTEVCGDCSASDPSWASINRGILLCADCCSVHRSLGRHISIVKSLRQGSWEPSVLNFVNSLNAHGANSVWEHHLLDGSHSAGAKNATKLKKPTPKDALHPTKSDFIKAKHVNLAFVLKPNLLDDDVNISNLENELSKQLHASVRTSNLETSLRLLVQGADPNFFHEEKCSTPLHVAAKFGQASQIELLLVYGADINAIDGNGLTPLEVAKANNHNTISERLLDAMYEVTDRLTLFLGGKKPDHSSGRHLVVPEANSSEIGEQLKIARNRLQLVPNKMFEELVMDIYDEVDRRENEAIWATSTLNADLSAVPFLPANPFLSATRNQGRQKLARFTKAEFAGLVTDVLVDALRRQKLANLRPLENAQSGNASFFNISSSTTYNSSSGIGGGVSGMDYDPNLSDDEPIYDPVASDDDYAPVPQPIAQQIGSNQSSSRHQGTTPPQTQIEVETLRKQLSEYEYEINKLKTVVKKLSSENSELKSKFSSAANIATLTSNPSIYDEPLRIDLSSTEVTDNEPKSLQESNTNSSSTSATNSNQSTIKRPTSMYEQRRLISNQPNQTRSNPETRTTTSMYASNATVVDKPQADDVKRQTDIVTKCLKDFVVSLQDANGLLPSVERTRKAVSDLISIFSNSGSLKDNLRYVDKLTRYNNVLQHECENLQKAFETEDKVGIEQFTNEVRQCAYYIASTIKTLVVQFD